ncbi:MAG: NAD(P)/FAD-dependent oxidoreductase [Ilyomonas sp.]
MIGNSKYDVAVIGGGLAGLSLAIQCADAGYNVILFEKEKYPFHKVCGEYISLESWNFLERLGVALSKFQLPIIEQLEVSDIKGNSYHFPLSTGGFGISRYKIDDLLYQIALQKDVTVLTQTKVQNVQFANNEFEIISSHGNFLSHIAVACYGKRSTLDVKWKRSFTQQKPNKLNNYIGVKYHVQYPQQKSKISLHNFHNGYCGISNIEDDTCCLCYLTTAHNLQKNNNSIQQMQKNVLYQNPYLKKIFTEARFLYAQPLSISQISFEKKSQTEEHILMTGDAAGMITPLCGNGMSMALHASKLAFESIDNFLQGNITREQMEERYQQRWQQAFAKRLFVGRTVQRMFGSNATTSIFLKSMKLLPFLATRVIKATHGESF